MAFFMKARLRFLLFYALFWLAFFQLARLLFLFYHFKKTRTLPFSDTLLSFWYGLRMDLSMTAYIFIPVCLFVILSVWIAFFRKPVIYLFYTVIILCLLLLVVLSDLELYGQWGFRIDDTPLRYLSSPREVWATVSHLPIFWIILGYLLCCFLFAYLFARLLKKFLVFQRPSRKLLSTLVLIAILPLMIIPIRGGFQLTPMNQSSVYFSRNHFANIAAINASWNFMHGVMTGTSSSSNPYHYLKAEEMKKLVDSLYAGGKVTSRSFINTSKPNIIYIVWESFTKKAVDLKWRGKEVTPYFNQLRSEGIYFSNAYASGDRTDKGIAAILSSYPALNKTSIIRHPGKLGKLPYFTWFLKQRGYKTSFYYGGETEFANIKSYLFNNGFDDIIDKNAFSKNEQNSKWGAHDGNVRDRIQKDLGSPSQPFFLTWLTLTSHEPYEVPANEVEITGDDATSRFLNSIHYTDKVVAAFIEFCKTQSWWKNTVIVIVGDHGHVLPEAKDRTADFEIPMLITGGAVTERANITRPVSQLDLTHTIAGSLGITGFSGFGKDLFDTTRHSWAFFTYNDAFGFIGPESKFVFDNVGKIVVQQHGIINVRTMEAGKALQQFIHEDYLRR
jgi:phosphoglycerol transferase MdoB-like AlkP superfamily enzyme